MQDRSLLSEARIEWNSRRLQRDQGQVRRIKPAERRCDIDRREVYRVERVVCRQVTLIQGFRSFRNFVHAERWIDQASSKLRLMIAVADDEEGVSRKFLSEPFQECPIFLRGYRLTSDILFHVRRIA